MPSHKEILQARVDDAAAAYTPAAAEADRLHGLIRDEKSAIDKLTTDHAAACRAIANGQDAETAAILAEKSRRTDHLTGLEALYKEVTETAADLNAAHIAHSRALQVELDREEREILTAAVVQAEQQLESAKKAVNLAEQARHAAVWARSRFDRHAELKLRETAKA